MNKIDKKIKILWVEDEAESGLLERKTYLELTDNYDLHIERNASDAEETIKKNTFDKIILDIRIPPGLSKEWENIHNGKERRLGLVLLERAIEILQQKKISYGICTVERWQDACEAILKIDPTFKPENQFLHKDDVIFPEDFELFIKKNIKA